MLCGFLSTHILDIGWINLVFWGAVGVGLGGFISQKREVLWCGGLFGFFLTISFLFTGFQGTSDKLLVFSILAAGLSLAGILGGIVSVYLGCWLRRRFRK